MTLLFGLAVRASGDTPAEFLQGVRPVADLINTPNVFSVVVAILAGLVGVISLTESRANALIGVFIASGTGRTGLSQLGARVSRRRATCRTAPPVPAQAAAGPPGSGKSARPVGGRPGGVVTASPAPGTMVRLAAEPAATRRR